jgi:hypothetical protein
VQARLGRDKVPGGRLSRFSRRRSAWAVLGMLGVILTMQIAVDVGTIADRSVYNGIADDVGPNEESGAAEWAQQVLPLAQATLWTNLISNVRPPTLQLCRELNIIINNLLCIGLDSTQPRGYCRACFLSVAAASSLSRLSSSRTSCSGLKKLKSLSFGFFPIQNTPARVRTRESATYRAWRSTCRGARKSVTTTSSRVSPCTPCTVVPNAGTIGNPRMDMLRLLTLKLALVW